MDMLQCARESQQRWARTFAGHREPVELEMSRRTLADLLDSLSCVIRLMLSERELRIRECAAA
ncbi:MAG: hypothetical protein JXC32_10515 [Anaerolineae bacterium]|nr:hypothetical protein [Anaerolineae bacterium]